MATHSVQIQTVLYNSELSSLRRSLASIRSALRANPQGAFAVGKCLVSYGDASREPVLTRELVDYIKDEFSEVFEFKYRFFNENTGTARGHNLLAEECGTDFIVIMNPDVVFPRNFFPFMLQPFFAHGEPVGIVEARQTPAEHPKEYDSATNETSWASGACIMTTLQVFKQVGGFDANSFFMYCDDVDYSWRIRAAGKRVVYQPQVPVFHPKRITNKSEWIPTEAEKYYSAEAALIMAYKWSQNRRWKMLVRLFRKSGDKNLQRAARVFSERLAKKSLPDQIDKKHRVSTFTGDLYAKHRF